MLLTTTEPAGKAQLEEDEWHRIHELLNAAFGAYQFLYYPTTDEPVPAKEEWLRVRDVALPAFMHYVGSGLLASVEQVDVRIQNYLTPFDAELADLLGISATDALGICRWIGKHLHDRLLASSVAAAAEKVARLALLERAEKEHWSLPDLRAATEASDYGQLLADMMRSIDLLNVVSLQDLKDVFPQTAENFWRRFTIKRGSGPALAYPTEQTAYDLHPLVLLDDASALCPSVNSVFSALLLAGEEALIASPVSKRYYRARDKKLERQGRELFSRFFGPAATIYSGLFEQPDSQFEHDLIVLAEDRCLIVEAKAAPPVLPFRDPDKAFTRLRRAFRADTGIQSGVDQANRLVRRLRQGEALDLFDAEGKKVLRLDPATFSVSYAVCLTRDDYGPLATNLNLLLEKAADDSYPWVVNVLDLETLCEAREYWGWPPADLFAYLDERLPLHGKAFTSDELDLFAFRLRHGTLRWIADQPADLFVVDPHYADLFDQMYRARSAGEPKIEIKPVPPVLTDLRRSLAEGRLVTVKPTPP